MPSGYRNVFDKFFDRSGAPRSNREIVETLLFHARNATSIVRKSFLFGWAMRYANKVGPELEATVRAADPGNLVASIVIDDAAGNAFRKLHSYVSEGNPLITTHPIGDDWFVVNLITDQRTRNISHEVALLLHNYGTLRFLSQKKIGDNAYANAVKATAAYWATNFASVIERELRDILNAGDSIRFEELP